MDITPMLRIVIILFIATLLSGCGQYGALYLPNAPKAESMQHQAETNAKNASTTGREAT